MVHFKGLIETTLMKISLQLGRCNYFRCDERRGEIDCSIDTEEIESMCLNNIEALRSSEGVIRKFFDILTYIIPLVVRELCEFLNFQRKTSTSKEFLLLSSENLLWSYLGPRSKTMRHNVSVQCIHIINNVTSLLYNEHFKVNQRYEMAVSICHESEILRLLNAMSDQEKLSYAECGNITPQRDYRMEQYFVLMSGDIDQYMHLLRIASQHHCRRLLQYGTLISTEKGNDIAYRYFLKKANEPPSLI